MKTLEGTSSSPSSILRSQGTSSSKHRTIDVYGKMGESVSETPRLRKRSISLGMKDMVSSKNEARDVLKTQLASPWNEKFSIDQHRPSPIHCLQTTEVDVNLISTDILSPNPRPLCALPPMNVPEGMVLPISCLVDAEGMFDSRRDVIYDNIGVATNRYAKSLNNLVTRDVDTPRVDSFTSILDNTDSESTTNFSMALCTVEQLQRMENFTIPMIEYLMPNADLGPTSMSNNGENEILAQSHALNKRVSEEDIIYGGNHHPLATIPPIVASARNANEKLRRDKIAEGIKSLQNSVPFSNKGNRDSVLDDAIDYIKFLKLQLKVLSQSRLCGEPTPYPFVHLEGYGHYLLHQQMCSEPLEEMMGELMNVSMQTANELLESKGLAILPMAFAYTILHRI